MAAAFIELAAIKLVPFCPTVTLSTTIGISLGRFKGKIKISHEQLILKIYYFFLRIDYSKTLDGILISIEALSERFSEESEEETDLLELSSGT